MPFYVYQSTSIGDTWAGEPVLATIKAYDKGRPAVGLNLVRIRGQRIAELHIPAGEALLWADRFRRAAEIAIAADEISEQDYKEQGKQAEREFHAQAEVESWEP